MKPSWLMLHLTIMQITSVSAQDASSSGLATSIASTLPSPSPTTLNSATSTSSLVPQTHTIQVGLLDHKIRPETTEAAIGDLIEFDFYPLNHSIVRAEYGFPCIPYEMTGSDKKGFFSGFKPVDKVLDRPPKWTLRINDTDPIFFYCAAPGSCITYGMVGGINLNSSTSIDKQRTLAMDSSYMLAPGEPFPAESPLPSGNPASSPLPSLSPNSASTSSSSSAHTSSGGLSTGAIVGISIAAFSALLFGALLFFCWGRTISLREAIERKYGTVRRVTASPNQMVQHTQSHHAYNASQGGFQFPPHPAVHPGSQPGSPDPGVYGQQLNASMGNSGYFPVPTGYTAKYTSPVETHPAYHAMSGSPPPGVVGLNGNPMFHQNGHERGTPAPGYYEPFIRGQEQLQDRPVEMEGVTSSSLANDSGNFDSNNKI
ncbi:hypothetical protein E8E13_004543 [Curvularia kusanoi]|uniref:Extracellular serine-rich protein n=1 Tax=Curvularia kusanoi TaxID=90978 RepID=A0A9P4W9N3_CURKU|nr:hypothetical protein E8E13_004543 [Curvularia kusanoi]